MVYDIHSDNQTHIKQGINADRYTVLNNTGCQITSKDVSIKFGNVECKLTINSNISLSLSNRSVSATETQHYRLSNDDNNTIPALEGNISELYI